MTNGGISFSEDEAIKEKAAQKASDTFCGTGFGPAGEVEDPYIQRCWPKLEPALPEFKELVALFLLPMYSHMAPLESE